MIFPGIFYIPIFKLLGLPLRRAIFPLPLGVFIVYCIHITRFYECHVGNRLGKTSAPLPVISVRVGIGIFIGVLFFVG